MLTAAQEKIELRTFIRNALAYFDSVAVGVCPVGDPAALYAEGRVCLMRLECVKATPPQPMTEYYNEI